MHTAKEFIRNAHSAALAHWIVPVWRSAFRLAPSVFLSPDEQLPLNSRSAATPERYRARDAKENVHTQPPDDEAVQMHIIWGVEFYTPSNYANLLEAFNKLGWNSKRENRETPGEQLQELRRNPRRGGWYNLGTIVRNDGWLVGDRRQGPLSKSVEYAFGEMFSVTSSITGIAYAFVLDQDASQRLDNATRIPRTTFFTPISSTSYSVNTPTFQKRAMVDRVRADLRSEISEWFARHLPGLFSSGDIGGQIVTAEFTTLRKTKLFPSRESPERPYLSLLGFDRTFDAWRSTETLGLYLLPRLRWDSKEDSHAVFTICEKDVDFSKLQSPDIASLVSSYGERLTKLISRWALLALIAGYERHINAVRDSAALRPAASGPLSVLGSLRNFIARSTEIAACSTELQKLAKDTGHFAYGCEEFTPCDERLLKHGLTTFDALIRNQIEGRAEWLANADESLREILTQYSTILSAQENYRVQQHVGRLTLIATIMAIVAALLAAENSAFIKNLLLSFD